MFSWKKLRNEINGNDSTGYLLAISGGVDSMLLLDFFRRQSAIPFHVAHFDHHIRESSHEDASIVREYCDEHLLPFSFGHGEGLSDIKNQECQARIQRWAFLNKTAIEYGCSHVVTAHHLNDQIENIFLRLIRGNPHSNLLMQKFAEIDGIVRYKPLLDVPKEEIVKTAKRMRVRWIEDDTNGDTSYDRNWMRQIIIPQLMERRNLIKSMANGINLTKIVGEHS